jgi:hypothetical protein
MAHFLWSSLELVPTTKANLYQLLLLLLLKDKGEEERGLGFRVG